MNGHLKISQHENTPDIFNLQYNYEPEDFHVEQCIYHMFVSQEKL